MSHALKKITQGFELLPHAADTRFKACGKTLKELFHNAVAGVAAFMKPGAALLSRRVRKEKQPIKVHALDMNMLLIEFLSEIVAQSDIHGKVYTDVVFKSFGENFLEGEIAGIKTDSFDREIKAISYDEVDIKKNPDTGLYETLLVFDV